MTDWVRWHRNYDRPDSPLARRLAVVQRFISQALDHCPPGPVRAISMCAGDARDLLGVLPNHNRGAEVSGRLVELHPGLAATASAHAPAGIEVACRDAGLGAAYLGMTPADLVLSCGIFGNVIEADIRSTIDSWAMLCRKGGFVIWTRGASEPDLRDSVREWTRRAGFEEVAFDGAPEKHGVGLARMVREPMPLLPNHRLFEFVPDRTQTDVSV